MLTGRRAFAAASLPETMAAIVNAPPADFGSGVSPQLQSIVLRCLEKNPERRFHAAQDLAFSLRSLSWERLGSEIPARYAAEGSIDSLAVIPFENMGGNPEMEYLSDGITETASHTRTVPSPAGWTQIARIPGGMQFCDFLAPGGHVHQHGMGVSARLE